MAKGNKATAKPQEASASAPEGNGQPADSKAKQSNSTSIESTAGGGKIGAAAAGVKAAITGNGSTDKDAAAASSAKKAKAKKSSKSSKSGSSWRKMIIGQKRMIFAVGIGAGLCVPATLQYLGIVQVVDVEEIMTPITIGLDETRLAVRVCACMFQCCAC